MAKKMLIDAAHPEETRVVVLNGNRVEDFDFESRARKQLRGNIYLAKVTRVEPSLQAAFVEYGGNRHGFLAFNEIHPDYYQIPHADREALMRDADDDDDSPLGDAFDDAEELGGEDDDERDEEIERRRRRLMRRYKIQEVIKRRQIMLVQVVKEERGNKGAALTTYLSLAGRYCVLMPNTDRGGGISRKITATNDRKRLRSIVSDLDVPEGMGLIVRTAGAKRTKAEIKRDYEYLSRAWTNIRDTTLHSVAPALIYEEEDLVKRAIRDLYDKEIEGVWVEGEAGFREAREFMRMLMPSQARKVQYYRGAAPLFVSHKIEDHLAQIYSPTVPLRSGGYLVINQTEALVAIDVNSGRSTRERNIEATALKTNLEAAEEAARQLRLRDLAGLVIIDFIDMDEGKNNRAVEKALKDALSHDRARIQMGRISPFGLMEISRQRRRTGILEGTTHVCPHCAGSGRLRSVESSALMALRAVELEALSGGGEIAVRAHREIALYILNHKRDYMLRLQRSHGVQLIVQIDDALAYGEHLIERLTSIPYEIDRSFEGADLSDLLDDDADLVDEAEEEEDDEDFGDDEESEAEDEVTSEEEDDEDDEDEDEDGDGSGPILVRPREERDNGRKNRRRRRRGGRRDEGGDGASRAAVDFVADDAESEAEANRRRRRGRRGGRRLREDTQSGDAYAWSWPARLSGEDPYEWRGPNRRVDTAAEAPEPATAAVVAEAASPAPSGPSPLEVITPLEASELGRPLEGAWVELPERTEAPGASRRARGRGRGRGRRGQEAEAASTDAVESEIETELSVEDAADDQVLIAEDAAEAPVEAVADPAPEPEAVAEVAVEAVTAAVEVVPEPVAVTTPVEAAPEPEIAAPVAVAPVAPPTPPEPDPAEITAPPVQPKRGWWRR